MIPDITCTDASDALQALISALLCILVSMSWYLLISTDLGSLNSGGLYDTDFFLRMVLFLLGWLFVLLLS